MKVFFNILAVISLSCALWSCEEKNEDVTALGANGIKKEYLSSKIDSIVSIRLTSLAPDRGLSHVDVLNPNGAAWGTVYMNNGQGSISLPRDSFELYALKNSGAYTLTTANEIQIPEIHFVAPEQPRMSAMTSVLIQPSASIQLLTDLVLADGRDSTKNVGTLTRSDAPVYFKFNTVSAQIDNPNFKLDEFTITLQSQNSGGKVLNSRRYDIKGDTVVFYGMDYAANDKVSLKVHYKMGKYSDDVTSTAYTVNAWKFQNDLANRTLSPKGNTYFNLASGWGAAIVPDAPHIIFNGNGSFTIAGGGNTTAVSARITGYTYSTRDVLVAKTRFNASTPTQTFDKPANNTIIAIRFQSPDGKGDLITSWGILQVVSITDMGTEDEVITFNYQYKPQSY